MSIERQTLADSTGRRQRSANWLHFWRFLTHPNRLASIIPSSGTLSRLVADHVRCIEGEFVVELGAGTGAITRAILDSGISARKLIAVEIDGRMAGFLRRTYPDITVIEGDALDIKRILAPSVIGRVGTVICRIPVSLLPLEREWELAEAIFPLMPAGRRFLAYSFRLTSPLPEERIGLVGKRLAFTLRNLPPASVWGYVSDTSGQNLSDESLRKGQIPPIRYGYEGSKRKILSTSMASRREVTASVAGDSGATKSSV